jgi:predicted nucleic acid-binding protein
LGDAAKVAPEAMLDALHTLVTRLNFVNEANIPLTTWMQAYRLCKGVDEKDTPYIALTLHLVARLWTDDGELKSGLRARGFDRWFEP